AISSRAHTESRAEPGEGESSSGYDLPAKAPPQGNGEEPEAGCRRQHCATRGETGGYSSPAPGRTDAIDPAGIRQPGGAGHHVDAATTATCPSRPDVARRHGASAVFNVG